MPRALMARPVRVGRLAGARNVELCEARAGDACWSAFNTSSQAKSGSNARGVSPSMGTERRAHAGLPAPPPQTAAWCSGRRHRGSNGSLPNTCIAALKGSFPRFTGRRRTETVQPEDLRASRQRTRRTDPISCRRLTQPRAVDHDRCSGHAGSPVSEGCMAATRMDWAARSPRSSSLIRRSHHTQAAPLQNCARSLLGAFSVDATALTDIIYMIYDQMLILQLFRGDRVSEIA